MTDESAVILGKLQGSVEGLTAGLVTLRDDILDRVETEANQREQVARSTKETLDRLEALFNTGLTSVRTDLTVRINDHETRLGVLENERARRQWLRDMTRPVTVLFWGGVGTAVTILVERLAG